MAAITNFVRLAFSALLLLSCTNEGPKGKKEQVNHHSERQREEWLVSSNQGDDGYRKFIKAVNVRGEVYDNQTLFLDEAGDTVYSKSDMFKVYLADDTVGNGPSPFLNIEFIGGYNDTSVVMRGSYDSLFHVVDSSNFQVAYFMGPKISFPVKESDSQDGFLRGYLDYHPKCCDSIKWRRFYFSVPYVSNETRP